MSAVARDFTPLFLVCFYSRSSFFTDRFPKSNFTGIDVTLEAVHLANQQRKDNGQTYDNLAFIQMDGAKLDDDWSDKYDWVTIFDAAHDQMRPDLVGMNYVFPEKHLFL
ncbi:hypothetical protein OESDEN_19394 [Oesophagostomum dentatum]|uniref:Methyltransferase domain-containing protein n=1 Tax=Oesophagostomum dentatum TaxID=61180 RepID=A0A0B1SCG1_OESDE|nr:hypothetical protein OESDEN_19394 [Oesophagostomum dentatum]